ncbi:hypothetical protein CPC08DRAFT_730749 [Agrocybe pediades]|nr:hypothetical protein CPC08DRAFT_730749 [Agrocybe pediades]
MVGPLLEYHLPFRYAAERVKFRNPGKCLLCPCTRLLLVQPPVSVSLEQNNNGTRATPKRRLPFFSSSLLSPVVTAGGGVSVPFVAGTLSLLDNRTEVYSLIGFKRWFSDHVELAHLSQHSGGKEEDEVEIATPTATRTQTETGCLSPLKRVNIVATLMPNLSPLSGPSRARKDDSDVYSNMDGQLDDREWNLVRRSSSLLSEGGISRSGSNFVTSASVKMNDEEKEEGAANEEKEVGPQEDGEDAQMQGVVNTASSSVPEAVHAMNEAEEVWLAEEDEAKSEPEEEQAIVNDAYMPEAPLPSTVEGCPSPTSPVGAPSSAASQEKHKKSPLRSRTSTFCTIESRASAPFSGPRPLSNGAASPARGSTLANANTNPATPTTTATADEQRGSALP